MFEFDVCVAIACWAVHVVGYVPSRCLCVGLCLIVVLCHYRCSLPGDLLRDTV